MKFDTFLFTFGIVLVFLNTCTTTISDLKMSKKALSLFSVLCLLSKIIIKPSLRIIEKILCRYSKLCRLMGRGRGCKIETNQMRLSVELQFDNKGTEGEPKIIISISC